MTGSPPRICPLCEKRLVETSPARHSIVLQDESASAENRRIERRLCRTCWEAEFDSVAHERVLETTG